MTDKKYHEDLTDEELKARIEDLEKDRQLLIQILKDLRQDFPEAIRQYMKKNNLGAYGDDLK